MTYLFTINLKMPPMVPIFTDSALRIINRNYSLSYIQLSWNFFLILLPISTRIICFYLYHCIWNSIFFIWVGSMACAIYSSVIKVYEAFTFSYKGESQYKTEPNFAVIPLIPIVLIVMVFIVFWFFVGIKFAWIIFRKF